MKGIYNHGIQHQMYQNLCKYGAIYGVIYYLGLETGLRISDLLALEYDILKNPPAGGNEIIAGCFDVVEGKTGKTKTCFVSHIMRGMIVDYRNQVPYDPKDPRLFKISRQTVSKYIKKAAENCGLFDIGCHSLRVTYAWNLLCTAHSFIYVRDALNHAFLSTTMLYLTDGVIWAIDRAYGANTATCVNNLPLQTTNHT
jgi:integrase